ncbi:glycoside hydrolase family 5 protein [Thalassotalea montiporae]
MKQLILMFLVILSCGYQAMADTWWTESYPKAFDKSALKPQPFIHVKGNQFVDEQGGEFHFTGVSIADPDKLAKQGLWSKALFDEIARWQANTIRIPIHPLAWRNAGQSGYLAYLDQAVRWANELGIYLIIDWHSIGNLQANLYQHPMYETSWQETLKFWQQIAFRYQNVPTVAVYELFNEPTNDYIGHGTDSLGKMTWTRWREMMEALIDLIRSYDRQVIPLVSGFNWAYDLRPVKHMPVERENIAYAVHPYPQKAKPKVYSRDNFYMLWHEQWGFVSSKAPMIASELGWSHESAPGAHVPVINNDGQYGPRIIDFMAARGISWVAWVFDPEWSPQLIRNWQFEPTEQGKFFKQVLQGKYQTTKE